MAVPLKLTPAQIQQIRDADAENKERKAKGQSVPGPKWKALGPLANFAFNPGILNDGYTEEGIAAAQESQGIESAPAEAARKAGERGENVEKFELGTLPAVKASPSDSSTLRYPSSPNITVNSDYVAFSFFKYDPPFGRRESNNEANTQGRLYNFGRSGEYTSNGEPTILMYMPEDISTGYKANWGGKAFSNIARNTLDSLGGETAMDKIKGATTAFGEAFGSALPLVGAAAIRKGIQKITGDSLSNDDIFGALSGAILNPNTELLFESTDMRNFQLRFKLVPRNETESTSINSIINVFKRSMLPRKTVDKVFKVGTEGVQNGFISVPDLCRVSFMKAGEEHPNLPKFKMCAITQVDVNYTPDGAYATYHDGQPVAIELSLNFQETKLVFSEDIEVGF